MVTLSQPRCVCVWGGGGSGEARATELVDPYAYKYQDAVALPMRGEIVLIMTQPPVYWPPVCGRSSEPQNAFWVSCRAKISFWPGRS